MAQVFIGAPFLAELDCRALELSVILLELTFKPGKKSEGIRSGARKTRDDSVIKQAAHLAGVALHYSVFQSHLTVAGHRNVIIPPHRQHRRAANNWPRLSPG